MHFKISRALTLACAISSVIAQVRRAELLGIGWVISFSRRLAI